MKRSGDETLNGDCKQAKLLKSDESVETAENISTSISPSKKKELEQLKEETVPSKSFTGNDPVHSDGTTEKAGCPASKTNMHKENVHSDKSDDISVKDDILGEQLLEQQESSDKTDAVKDSTGDVNSDMEGSSTKKKERDSPKKRPWRSDQSRQNTSNRNDSSDKYLTKGKKLSSDDGKKHYSEEEKNDKPNSSPSKDGGSVSSQEIKKKISSSDKPEDSSHRKAGQNSSPQKKERSGSRREERQKSSPHKDRSSESKRDRDKLSDSKRDRDKLSDSKRDRDKLSDSKRDRDKSSDSKRDRDKLSDSKRDRDKSSDSTRDRDKLSDSKRDRDKSSDSKRDRYNLSRSRENKDIREYFPKNSSSRHKKDEKTDSNSDYPSSSQKVKSPRKESRFSSVELETKSNLQDSISLLKQDYSKDRKEHFHFFFGKDSPFSNFHPAKFDLDGVTYSCSEQYMMYKKAEIFQDPYHGNEIMKATDPVIMKKLGRKVENFDANHWAQVSEKVVKKGIMAKFKQNKYLLGALIATFPMILVEAAPRDRLWGIGLGAKNPKAHCRKTWRGKNKLGYFLTDIRNEIMKNEGYFS